jgi:hypothetical protein
MCVSPPEDSQRAGPPAPAEAPSRFSWPVALKWIGGASAVLSLFFAIRQFTTIISDRRTRQREVLSLLASANLQASHGEFTAAWTNLVQAAALKSEPQRVQAAREDLAMRWLEDARAPSNTRTLTALADTTLQVLARGIAGAAGARKADLLAHLGWAEFLKWREGAQHLKPRDYYDSALAVSPGNPYAHAMLAHWMLWTRGAVDSARSHFAAALAADSARAFVRTLQVAGYANVNSTEGDRELLRAAVDMQERNEPVSPEAQNRVWRVYSSCLVVRSVDCNLAELRGTLPAASHLRAFEWVFANSGYPGGQGLFYDYALARLQEEAGEGAKARTAYETLRSKIPAYNDRLRAKVTAAQRRLSSRR